MPFSASSLPAAKPVWLTLAVLTSAAGAYLLFTRQMQHNPAFANWVGSWSPALANQFGCACPLCSGFLSGGFADGPYCPGQETGATRYQAWDVLLRDTAR